MNNPMSQRQEPFTSKTITVHVDIDMYTYIAFAITRKRSNVSAPMNLVTLQRDLEWSNPKRSQGLPLRFAYVECLLRSRNVSQTPAPNSREP
jgi:hypothetical protein